VKNEKTLFEALTDSGYFNRGVSRNHNSIIKTEESGYISLNDFYLNILKTFLGAYYLEKFVPKYTVNIIKNLLQELQPGDEITLEQATIVIQQECLPHRPEDTFIWSFLQSIGTEVPGFQFVRLKQSIRHNRDAPSTLPDMILEIDHLFDQWDHQPLKKV
jgi:hypothetical protein